MTDITIDHVGVNGSTLAAIFLNTFLIFGTFGSVGSV